MAQAPLSIDAILTLLTRIPATVIETTSGLGDADLSRRAEPDQWSLVEILAHLRVSADLRGDQRIERMLTQDEPTFRTRSPRAEEFARGYAELPFWESFRAYSEQRTRLHARLCSLAPEEWGRGAVLTGIRPVRYQTVHDEADALVRHEVRHLNQVKRTTELLRSSGERQRRGRSTTPVGNGRNLLRQ
jgi:hypothetical protein